MKRQNTKQVLVSLLGIFLCKVSIAGCFPLIPAYFAAGCLEGSGRLLLAVFMTLGMAVLLPVTAMAKYLMVILVTAVVIRLMEWVNKGCFTWAGALTAGVATTLIGAFGELMNLKNRTALWVDLLEGIFVFGATMVISRMLHSFLEWKLKPDDELPAQEDHMQRLKDYAQSFQGLSDTIQKMKMEQADFTPEEMGQIQNEITGRLCANCDSCAVCWEKEDAPMYGCLSQLIESIRQAGCADRDARLRMEKYCPYAGTMVEEALHVFERARLNLSWYNRLIENREVIAEQLDAMAYIMEDCARPDVDISREKRSCLTELKYRAKEHGVLVAQGRIFEKTDGHIQLKVYAWARSGCVPVKELTKAVEKALGIPMMPHRDDRALIGREKTLFTYEEKTGFQSIYGVARLVKDGAPVSGDNFSFMERPDGSLILSLSDGMGSGVRACKESETVIELLEKFLEAGFGMETAIRMMNSAMVIKGEEDLFSTVDIAKIDLYTGGCRFYKIGAAPTFIRHAGEVECLVSTSLPAGVYHRLEIEQSQKQLAGGDFLVMVTDGVLEYLHVPKPEETMQEIIAGIETNNPGTLAKRILEHVLLYTGGMAPDDMTVLVAGIWEKS